MKSQPSTFPDDNINTSVTRDKDIVLTILQNEFNIAAKLDQGVWIVLNLLDLTQSLLETNSKSDK